MRGYVQLGKIALGDPGPSKEDHVIIGILIFGFGCIFIKYITELLTGVPIHQWMDPVRARLRRRRFHQVRPPPLNEAVEDELAVYSE